MVDSSCLIDILWCRDPKDVGGPFAKPRCERRGPVSSTFEFGTGTGADRMGVTNEATRPMMATAGKIITLRRKGKDKFKDNGCEHCAEELRGYAHKPTGKGAHKGHQAVEKENKSEGNESYEGWGAVSPMFIGKRHALVRLLYCLNCTRSNGVCYPHNAVLVDSRLGFSMAPCSDMERTRK
jgi:hypothetical protein